MYLRHENAKISMVLEKYDERKNIKKVSFTIDTVQFFSLTLCCTSFKEKIRFFFAFILFIINNECKIIIIVGHDAVYPTISYSNLFYIIKKMS